MRATVFPDRPMLIQVETACYIPRGGCWLEPAYVTRLASWFYVLCPLCELFAENRRVRFPI
jgi:hypothetical protein